MEVLKIEKAETHYTLKLSESELGTILSALGATNDEECKSIAIEYGYKMVNSTYDFYNDLIDLYGDE